MSRLSLNHRSSNVVLEERERPRVERSRPEGAGALFAVALASVFLGALDLTVIATILVRIVPDLGINTADLDRYIWVVNGYLLAYVVAIPLIGRLSDVVGRTQVFVGALMLFVVGSVLCATATDLLSLVIARAVQGAGGGALLPVTMALVGDLMPPRRRTAALGLVGSVDTLGWVLGPIWGAAVVGVLSSVTEAWRWVFWLNVPFGLVAAGTMLIARRRLEATGFERDDGAAPRSPFAWRDLDLPGAVLFSVVLVCLNLALSAGGELGLMEGQGTRALGGSENPLGRYVWPLLGGAAIGALVFALWESRARQPLIPLGLLKMRAFLAAMASNLFSGAALMVVMVDVPLVVALRVAGEDASSVSAAMLAPFTVMMAVLSWFGGRWALRFGEHRTALAGIILAAVGLVGLWLGLDGGELLWMVPGLLVSGAGFGLLIAPIAASAIDAVPAKDRGIAAGLAMVGRLLGMSLGSSAITALGVRRLETLTGRIEPIVRQPEESTAAFLVRQQQYVEEHVIPLTVQVIQETFLWAALIVLIASVPVWFLPRRPQQSDSEEQAGGVVRDLDAEG